MPELPEVEVTRRSFAQRIAGAQIQALHLGKPLRWPLGVVPQSLVGRTVRAVRRRGKYLLLDLDEGMLMLHLGMSGSLRFDSNMPAAGIHDHMDLVTTHGTLRLHDPRRFGAVMAVSGEADPWARKLLDGLGMEPLDDADFVWTQFAQGLKASKTPIKQLLLGGKLVVGVGNIYASEVLFASRIHPLTPAREISTIKAKRLFHAIQRILAQSVALGGTTLRDFASDGMPGHFQTQTQVYGRQGLPCTHCATPIAAIQQGQRSTFFCPRCQKP